MRIFRGLFKVSSIFAAFPFAGNNRFMPLSLDISATSYPAKFSFCTCKVDRLAMFMKRIRGTENIAANEVIETNDHFRLRLAAMLELGSKISQFWKKHLKMEKSSKNGIFEIKWNHESKRNENGKKSLPRD